MFVARTETVGNYHAKPGGATERELHKNEHDRGRVVYSCHFVCRKGLPANRGVGQNVQFLQKVRNDDGYRKFDNGGETRPRCQVQRLKQVFDCLPE